MHSCNGILIGNRMWYIEWRHCQCPWMTLKVTFAVWMFFDSHTSWNIARTGVARSLCSSWASYSVPSQDIGWEERLQNDLFCVGWNVNLNSTNFTSGEVVLHPACRLFDSGWWTAAGITLQWSSRTPSRLVVEAAVCRRQLPAEFCFRLLATKASCLLK